MKFELCKENLKGRTIYFLPTNIFLRMKILEYFFFKGLRMLAKLISKGIMILAYSILKQLVCMRVQGETPVGYYKEKFGYYALILKEAKWWSNFILIMLIYCRYLLNYSWMIVHVNKLNWIVDLEVLKRTCRLIWLIVDVWMKLYVRGGCILFLII